MHRELKYPAGVAISNFPFWKQQMASGMALAIMVFAAAWLTLRRQPWTPRLACWIAVGLSATTAGILLGMAAEKMVHESYGFGRWLGWGSLLAAAIASPLCCANALMSGRAIPTFLELIGPREARTRSFCAIALGLVLAVLTLTATEIALGPGVEPRWRDFPFASLTMAAVPIWTLVLLNRPKFGPRPVAEAVFATLFAGTALYVAFNEGSQNWQALWTSGAYFLLGATLWQARSVAVAEKTSSVAVAIPQMDLPVGKAAVLNPAE